MPHTVRPRRPALDDSNTAGYRFVGGRAPKVVQERLEHATISITLDAYSHVTPTMQGAAADRFAAAVFGS
jgi:integrase